MATMIPATAPMAEPRAKVNEITLLTLMPIRAAPVLFWDRARIAVPVLVLLIMRKSVTMSREAMMKIDSCSQLTLASPIVNAVVLKKLGRASWTKGLGLLPQIIIARFCRKIDMPMAVMRAASLGACLKGL